LKKKILLDSGNIYSIPMTHYGEDLSCFSIMDQITWEAKIQFYNWSHCKQLWLYMPFCCILVTFIYR